MTLLPPVPHKAPMTDPQSTPTPVWADWFKQLFARVGGHQGYEFTVQEVHTKSGAVATGTTTIPFDDSIPQITEGTEFITASITPQSSENRLTIEAVLYFTSSDAARHLIAALFQDATASALATSSEYIDAADGSTLLILRHEMAAGTIGATTFRIRAGTDSAATVTFNGVGGLRRFGGVTVSSLKVSERVSV